MTSLRLVSTLTLGKNKLTELPSWLKDFTFMSYLNIIDNPLNPRSVIEYLKNARAYFEIMLSADLYKEIIAIEPQIQNLHSIEECYDLNFVRIKKRK